MIKRSGCCINPSSKLSEIVIRKRSESTQGLETDSSSTKPRMDADPVIPGMRPSGCQAHQHVKSRSR